MKSFIFSLGSKKTIRIEFPKKFWLR